MMQAVRSRRLCARASSQPTLASLLSTITSATERILLSFDCLFNLYTADYRLLGRTDYKKLSSDAPSFPVRVQCATGAAIFAAGDLVAQQVVEKRGLKGHDLSRTARVVAYRGLVFGPLLTKWFQHLNGVNASTSIRTLAYRVGLDQFLAGPMFIGLFYTSMSVMEGVPHEALPRLERAFLPSLMVGWGLYMPVQIINFTLVPAHLRVLFVSGISLFWNAYLSAANNQHSKGVVSVPDTMGADSIDTALPIPVPVALPAADVANAASTVVATAASLTSKVKNHTPSAQITTTGSAIA